MSEIAYASLHVFRLFVLEWQKEGFDIKCNALLHLPGRKLVRVIHRAQQHQCLLWQRLQNLLLQSRVQSTSTAGYLMV